MCPTTHPPDEQAKWDTRYRDAAGAPVPARVLVEFQHLLPESGTALDLACGLGGNALLLATRGLDTSAWDLSPVAIGRLLEAAGARGLSVRAQVRDVVVRPPEAERFDVIVVSRFLERPLAPRLAAALRPGGRLYYQTFTREPVTDAGPRSAAYRLGRGELLAMFPGLRVLAYREEGRVGNLRQGLRDEAMLVAQRDSSAYSSPDAMLKMQRAC